MESLLGLGFRETMTGEVDDKSQNQKLVPWLSWDEWELVRASLFSNSPDSIAFALDRIASWRSRGCLPVTVEVTASIIKIQLKDPVFRPDLNNDVSEDEEILAMLYSMAVMRLVNGLIEKTRRRTVVSIAQAAASINMPRMLIDIRHEASHRELPSLCLLRQASSEALNWLKSYYWDPQMMAIPFRGGESGSVREEISSKLHQLALGLEKKKSLKLSSSDIKEKRSRKQINKTLKSLVNLYAFYASEVISILLEFLLAVTNPLNMVEFPQKFQDSLHLDFAQTAFDKWKPVISKFSKKEPELLLRLLNAVLDMIEARQVMKDDIGQKQYSVCMYEAETSQIGVLSSLFSWLVEILKAQKSLYCDTIESVTDKKASALPKSILFKLLHRCLLISEPGNNELLSSASCLAEVIGNGHLKRSLNKLSLIISTPCPDLSKDTFESLVLQEKDVQQASEKVELLKHRRLNSSSTQAINSSLGSTGKWTLVESWKPCPIGMLPRTLGSSGCLPVLDCKNELKETSEPESRKEEHETLSFIDNMKLRRVSNLGNQENREAGNSSSKRRAGSDLDELINPVSKRLQGSTHNNHSNASIVEDNEEHSSTVDWSRGRLLMNGVFRRVEEEEVKMIQSRIRILARIPGLTNSDENWSCRIPSKFHPFLGGT
ncbi:hypothetical protein V2J09_000918 [Rumex salicifolius]